MQVEESSCSQNPCLQNPCSQNPCTTLCEEAKAKTGSITSARVKKFPDDEWFLLHPVAVAGCAKSSQHRAVQSQQARHQHVGKVCTLFHSVKAMVLASFGRISQHRCCTKEKQTWSAYTYPLTALVSHICLSTRPRRQ